MKAGKKRSLQKRKLGKFKKKEKLIEKEKVELRYTRKNIFEWFSNGKMNSLLVPEGREEDHSKQGYKGMKIAAVISN
jgi:hypothetical protein